MNTNSMLNYFYRHKTMLLLLAVVALFAWGRGAVKSGALSDLHQVSLNNNPNWITGAGPNKPEARALANFYSVESSGDFVVTWSPSDKSSVVIEAPENVLSHIKTEVADGTLRIYPDSSLSLENAVHITLYGPQLQKVNILGTGTFTGSNLSGQNLDLDISGAGSISLSGQVQDLQVNLVGSGKLAAGSLKANSVKIEISGSGNATVNASNKLDASVVGMGKVRYQGSPKDVTKDISGSGSIEAE